MIQGKHVTLRAPIPEDSDVLLLLRNNIELQHLLMSKVRANTTFRINEWLEKKISDECTLFFIIASAKTNTCYGYIQLANLDFLHGVAELGICIASDVQGKGYGQEAIKLLEMYASSQYRIRKITLTVLRTNHYAIAFYEKIGFRHVGYWREHFYAQSAFHDVLLMEKMISSK